MKKLLLISFLISGYIFSQNTNPATKKSNPIYVNLSFPYNDELNQITIRTDYQLSDNLFLSPSFGLIFSPVNLGLKYDKTSNQNGFTLYSGIGYTPDMDYWGPGIFYRISPSYQWKKTKYIYLNLGLICNIYYEIDENILYMPTYDGLGGIFPFLQLSIKPSLSVNKKTINTTTTDNIKKNKSVSIGISTNHSPNIFDLTYHFKSYSNITFYSVVGFPLYPLGVGLSWQKKYNQSGPEINFTLGYGHLMRDEVYGWGQLSLLYNWQIGNSLFYTSLGLKYNFFDEAKEIYVSCNEQDYSNSCINVEENIKGGILPILSITRKF